MSYTKSGTTTCQCWVCLFNIGTINSACVDREIFLLAVCDPTKLRHVLEFDTTTKRYQDLEKPGFREDTVDIKDKSDSVLVKAVIGREAKIVIQMRGRGYTTLAIPFKYQFFEGDAGASSRVILLAGPWLFYIGQDGELVRTDIDEHSPKCFEVHTSKISGFLIHLAADEEFIFCLSYQGTVYKVNQKTLKVEAVAALHPSGVLWTTIATQGTSVLVGGHRADRADQGVLARLTSELEVVDWLSVGGPVRHLTFVEPFLCVAAVQPRSVVALGLSGKKVTVGPALELPGRKVVGTVKSAKGALAYGVDILFEIGFKQITN